MTNNPKKRILIFSLAYFPHAAGAEIAVKEITERIAEAEFDMVTLRFSREHPKFERIGSINVYRIGGGLGYLSKILFIPQAAFVALKLHRAKKYDALWSVMTYMGFPAIFFKWIHNIPLLLTIQDGDSIEHITKRWRIKLFGLLYKTIFQTASVIQAISHHLADFARHMGARCPILVVPNGVDIQGFSGVSAGEVKKAKEILRKKDGDISLITTSRLVAKNAVEDIISAMPMLPENVKLIIAGEGAQKENLKKLSEILGVSEKINFIGWIPHEELPGYLKASDIFIRTPVSEGFGISYVEAMAAGIPVIATPVGGILDFVKERETGLFAEVWHPESIANAVLELMKNPNLVSKIKRGAFEMVKEKYDWQIIAEEMKRIFNGL